MSKQYRLFQANKLAQKDVSLSWFLLELLHIIANVDKAS